MLILSFVLLHPRRTYIFVGYEEEMFTDCPKCACVCVFCLYSSDHEYSVRVRVTGILAQCFELLKIHTNLQHLALLRSLYSFHLFETTPIAIMERV